MSSDNTSFLGTHIMTTQAVFKPVFVISNVTFTAVAAGLYYKGSQTDLSATYGDSSESVNGNQLLGPALTITKAGEYRLYLKGTYGSQVHSWYIDITVNPVAGP